MCLNWEGCKVYCSGSLKNSCCLLMTLNSLVVTLVVLLSRCTDFFYGPNLTRDISSKLCKVFPKCLRGCQDMLMAVIALLKKGYLNWLTLKETTFSEFGWLWTLRTRRVWLGISLMLMSCHQWKIWLARNKHG